MRRSGRREHYWYSLRGTLVNVSGSAGRAAAGMLGAPETGFSRLRGPWWRGGEDLSSGLADRAGVFRGWAIPSPLTKPTDLPRNFSSAGERLRIILDQRVGRLRIRLIINKEFLTSCFAIKSLNDDRARLRSPRRIRDRLGTTDSPALI